VLAKAGYGARPRAEAIVREGRVRIDGRIVDDPGHPVEPTSEVVLDGARLREVDRHYFLLHKPRGVDCQERRHAGRWLGDLLPDTCVGLEPAGRLDTRARGLLLVSNDLWWNARVAENADLERRYEIVVRGTVRTLVLDLLRAGVTVPSQGTFRPESVRVAGESEQQTTLVIGVRGGHHRQVRAVLTSLRLEIVSLARTGLGPLDLERLAPGDFRELATAEIGQLARGGSDG
jgi:23S rRNA pseudouridine2605 synthase